MSTAAIAVKFSGIFSDHHITAGAGPALDTGRITVDHSIIRHILGNNRPRTDKCPLTDGYTTDDGSVCTDTGAFFDTSCQIIAGGVAGKFAARSFHIGKDHTGSAKHIVFQYDPFVDADVVLYFHIIANFDVAGDENVLPDSAVFSYLHVRRNMAKVPNLCAFADNSRFIYIRRFV